MKNIQSIISNLAKNHLKKLSTIGIINKLILTLPKALRKNILFTSVKNETLFIATKHISTCIEINKFRANDILNAINLILDSAKKDSMQYSQSLDFTMVNFNEDLEILSKIKSIKAYVPTHILEQTSQDSDEKIAIIYYKERAKGDFAIIEDSPFRDIFEEIKIAIKRNLDDELKREN